MRESNRERSSTLAQRLSNTDLEKNERTANSITDTGSFSIGYVFCPERQKLEDTLKNLLTDSGILSEKIMSEAGRLSRERAIPLSYSLLTMRCIGFPVLNYAFECISFIQQGKISLIEAVDAMKAVNREHTDLALVLFEKGIVGKSTLTRIRVGDLLLSGGLVDEKTMLSKVEESLLKKALIGEVLLTDGLITSETLSDVISLQKLCASGVLEKRQAAKLLRKTARTGISATKLLCQEETLIDDELDRTALGLVLTAEFIDTEDLLEARKEFGELAIGDMKALVARGRINESIYNASRECGLLVDNGWLSEAEAIALLHHCERTKDSVKDALANMGISKVDDLAREQVCSIEKDVHDSRAWTPKLTRTLSILCISVLLAFSALVASIVSICKTMNFYGLGPMLVILIATVLMVFIRRHWQNKVAEKLSEIELSAETARDTYRRLSALHRA